MTALFSPRLIGDFIFGLTSHSEPRWFRVIVITSFEIIGTEIIFRVDESQNAEVFIAGRARTEEEAKLQLFKLLNALTDQKGAK